MAAGSQLDGTPCESPDGSHSGLAGISQAEHDNQLDANQGALVVGASCCLADECQATTWNDDGSVILSQPPTGLVDWTSLHREELSKRVVQSMGKCFVLLGVHRYNHLHIGLSARAKCIHMFTRYEWSLAYTNSRRPFQFFGHWDHGKTTDDMYLLAQYPPVPSIPKAPPSVNVHDFTFLPTTYNKSAPYRPYIQRLPSDPKHFSMGVGVKTSAGYTLESQYLGEIEHFFNKNQLLFQDWKSVAEALSISVVQFTPRLPPAESELHVPRLSSTYLAQAVHDNLQCAYEFGGCARLLARRCIRHIARTFGASPPKMGVDETLIGAIFAFPANQRDVLEWLNELLDDGVPVFGVVEGPMQPPAKSIPEIPDGVQVDAPEGTTLPTSRHIVRVEHRLQHVAHPRPWRIRPPNGYPGDRQPRHSGSLEWDLHNALFPDYPMPIKLVPEMITKIRRILGYGPFPLGRNEVELVDQITDLSLHDNLSPSGVPSSPKPSGTQVAPSLSYQNPYAEFEAMDSDEINGVATSEDDIPWDMDTDGSGVKFDRNVERHKKKKEADLKEVREAAELLEKANDGDEGALAEVMRRLNAEQGHTKTLPGAGRLTASAGVLYLRQHFRNHRKPESKQKKHLAPH